MTKEEVRVEFIKSVQSCIEKLGFIVKQKSKASGWVIFEWTNENSVRYTIQLTFTSFLDVNPRLNVSYKEVDQIVKKLDKTFAKNQGTSTFNSYFFEVINPANADGYLNESAGSPYYQIKGPFFIREIERQALELCTKIILPALSNIIEQTKTLKDADNLLNKQNPIRPGRNRLLTSVLCNPIPLQMVMSLLIGRLNGRVDAPDLIAQYENYVREEYHTDNSWVFLLEKVLKNV